MQTTKTLTQVPIGNHVSSLRRVRRPGIAESCTRSETDAKSKARVAGAEAVPMHSPDAFIS